MDRPNYAPRVELAARLTGRLLTRLPKPQLRDYAFNVFGYAMEIPEGLKKRGGTTINAYEASVENSKKYIAEVKKQSPEVFRKTSDFTPRELSDEVDAGVEKFLVVGLTYPKLPDDVFWLHKSQGPRTATGTVLHDQSIVKPADSQAPTLVVAPEIRKSGGTSALYVLVCPREGLCQAIPVKADAVFYLPVFRDDAKTFRKRLAAWNKKIRGHQTLRRPKKPKSEPVADKEEEDEEVVVEYTIVEPADYLPMFLDNNEEEWDKGSSEMFVDAFHTKWPHLQKKWPTAPEIKVEDVTLIKLQLVDQNIVVLRRLLRPFIIDVMARLQDMRSWGADVNQAAQKSRDHVRVVFGIDGWTDSAAVV